MKNLLEVGKLYCTDVPGKLYASQGELWLHSMRGLTDDEDAEVLGLGMPVNGKAVYEPMLAVRPGKLLVLLETQTWTRGPVHDNNYEDGPAVVYRIKFLCDDFVGYARITEENARRYFAKAE